MKQKLLALLLTLCVLAGLLPAAAIRAEAADALPAELVLAPSEANGLPAAIRLIRSTNYDLYIPGNLDPAACFFSWEGGLNANDGTGLYASGTLPIPAPGETKTYTFTLGSSTASFTVKTWQGTADLKPVFMEIDESQGTIAAIKDLWSGLLEKSVVCVVSQGGATHGTDINQRPVPGRGPGREVWRNPERSLS